MPQTRYTRAVRVGFNNRVSGNASGCSGWAHNLTPTEQVHYYNLFDSGPENFKRALNLWRAKHPNDTLLIGPALSRLDRPDLTQYALQDFAQMDLRGAIFSKAQFAESASALPDRIRELGAVLEGYYTVGNTKFAQPVHLSSTAMMSLKRGLQKDPSVLSDHLENLRRSHRGVPISLGELKAFRPDFTTLSPDDFRGFDLRGATFINPKFPDEQFKIFLERAGAILTGDITIGDKVVTATARAPRGR